MALINCDFFSEALSLSCSMTVILPQETRGQVGMTGRSRRRRHPVLYLLHGYSDDHTIWLRRTSIERYAAPLGLAVVMPAVHKSYYTDMAAGDRYWTFISRELPALCRQFFPISTRREDTFAAGLSMGGYGAFKLALRQPNRFAAAASLSGALDIATRMTRQPAARQTEFARIFGSSNRLADSNNDLFHVAAKLADSGRPRPKLFQCCGTEDFLHDENLRARDHFRRLGFELTYEDGPGTHEWGYWDANIQRVLAWLPLAPAEAQ
jgi:S-formylglutathione hydrolase FrmB